MKDEIFFIEVFKLQHNSAGLLILAHIDKIPLLFHSFAHLHSGN